MLDQEKIVFQITDWGYFHEEEEMDEIQIKKYCIQIYGTTKEGKKVYVRVDDFTPYFYVEIPRDWQKRRLDQFMDGLKTLVHRDEKNPLRNSLKSYDTVNKHKFTEFTNYKKFKFLRLIFYNYEGFRAYERVLKRPNLEIRSIQRSPLKLKLYESNIEPNLRFMHHRDLNSCGWASISKYDHFPTRAPPTSNAINVYTYWKNVDPVDDASIVPLIVASYDIECTSCDGAFPQAQRDDDRIIGIGTAFNRYGESLCYKKHIVTLGTCDPIDDIIVDAIDIDSFPGTKKEQEDAAERKVLLTWRKMITDENPDIMTGYNIFGFDYKYIEARAAKLGCAEEFSVLGRLKHEKCKFATKDLSSAALGKNILYYYEMSGRINVDLMKVIQRDHKLQSYKLDSVAATFIREGIKKLMVDKTKNTTTIYSGSTYGLSEGGFIKIYYNDGLSDNSYRDDLKLEIKKLGKDDSLSYIIVDGIVDDLDVSKYKSYWCQAKDDVKPREIFELQKGSSKDRAIIAKYCIQDCVLVNQIMEKLQVLTNNIGMANVCSVPLSYIFLRGQGIKVLSLVAKKCRQKEHLIPYTFKPYNVDRAIYHKKTEKEKEEEEQFTADGYEGATVFKPHKGIHQSAVPVLDYSSLYPSSMIHRNISHECLVKNNKYMNIPGYLYYDVTYYNKDGTETKCIFAKSKKEKIGILPEILKDLLGARSRTRKLAESEKDPFKAKIYDGLQLAYKITANSLYGQTGASTSAIYKREIAASTTATGREMLNCARLFAEYIYRKIVLTIIADDYDLYVEQMNLILGKKMDELLGEKLIARLKQSYYKDNDDPKDMSHLKKPNDYFYLRVFQEKLETITDDNFKDDKNKITNKDDFLRWFYDDLHKTMKGLTINPKCTYGDTDSIFVGFGISDENGVLTNHRSLEVGIRLGIMCGKLINLVLPAPQNLTYEKTFWPFILLSKKRYVGNLYEYDPNKFYQKSMGIVLKRRDNAPIVKIVVGGIVDKLLNEKSDKSAVRYTHESLKNILNNKFDMDKYIITKTLKGNGMTSDERQDENEKIAILDERLLPIEKNAICRLKKECEQIEKDIKRGIFNDYKERKEVDSRLKDKLMEIETYERKNKNMIGNATYDKLRKEYELLIEKRPYKNRSSQVHAVLADRMADRDSGNRPMSNDRIPYAYVVTEKEPDLQGDRVENPEYIRENKLKLDYLFYITNQIMKPAIQFLENIVKDANKIFQKYITIEENNRKGAKPVQYYLDSDDSKDKKGIPISDDNFEIETKKKPKAKNTNRKKKIENKMDIKKDSSNGGFLID